MKSLMLASAAMLCFTTVSAGVAVAQDMSAPAGQPPAGGATGTVPADATGAAPADPSASPTPPADPAAGMPPAAGTPAAPAGDPNAGQPSGAVPADPGMAPAPAGQPQDSAAPVGSSANPAVVGGNMTPAPTEAKDYPVCSKTVQDSCINPGEARKARKRR